MESHEKMYFGCVIWHEWETKMAFEHKIAGQKRKLELIYPQHNVIAEKRAVFRLEKK